MAAVKRDRTYYKNSKKWRDHEREMKMWDAFARDPELKYFMGMAAGAGVAMVGGLIKEIGPVAKRDYPPNRADYDDDQSYVDAHGAWMRAHADDQVTAEDKTKTAYGWLLDAVQHPTKGALDLMGGMDFAGTDTIVGQIGNILTLGGTGFAGTCAMILILRSIFSGTDLGDMLQGVGSIVPG